MSGLGAALVGAAVLLTACTHYNTLYNSRRLFDEAERHRVEGRDSLSRVLYEDVIRKTSEAYRARPLDEGAAETLYLLGLAQLRAGDLLSARLALAEAARRAPPGSLGGEIEIYRAMIEARAGEIEAAIARVDAALADTSLSEVARSEGRLLRGSLRLAGRPSATGWVDLDLAAAAGGVGVESGLERLRLALSYGERDRARAAMEGLLANIQAGARFDSTAVLLRIAAERWGPVEAAELLAPADSTHWEQPARGRIRLERARWRREAGDTLGALADARFVSRARGDVGAEARLLLAGWRLEGARDLGALAAVRPLLLPAGDHPAVESLLAAIDRVERYAGLGLDRPLGWFAAAEVARDQLRAPVLARGLFLAYADIDPSAPWAPKALLAALGASVEESDRAWLRGRLEAHRTSPYVLAARGGSSAGFEALEQELGVRLTEITGR